MQFRLPMVGEKLSFSHESSYIESELLGARDIWRLQNEVLRCLEGGGLLALWWLCLDR